VNKIQLGQLMDLFVGFRLAEVDKDTRRRELYGKAGAIRFKPYGIEYRTPSNYWIMSEHNIAAVWDLTGLALAAVKRIGKFPAQVMEATRTFIDSGCQESRGRVNEFLATENPLK